MDGSGYIELAELKQALDLCGFKIPQYQVRQMIDEYDRDQSASSKGRLSFDEFESVRLHSSFVYFFFCTKKNIGSGNYSYCVTTKFPTRIELEAEQLHRHFGLWTGVLCSASSSIRMMGFTEFYWVLPSFTGF